MKFLSSEKLSEHKYKTPEGYLICTDAILARTGKQTYRRSEVFSDSEDDSEIEVDRKAEEVFAPATLASFENKPVTVEHPDENVTPDNYNNLSVGFVRDVRRGKTQDGQDVMLGTLVITDAQTIEEIENGEHTDLSCGYDCDIADDADPQQRNIRGNHVALCEQGRAGIARIVDSVKDASCKDDIVFDYTEKDLAKAKEMFEKAEDETEKKLLKTLIDKIEFELMSRKQSDSKCKDGWAAEPWGKEKLESYIRNQEKYKRESTSKGDKEWAQKQIDWAKEQLRKLELESRDSVKDVDPREGESKEDFIARFMSETKEEYPDEKQRFAVANSYWERKSTKDSKYIEYKGHEIEKDYYGNDIWEFDYKVKLDGKYHKFTSKEDAMKFIDKFGTNSKYTIRYVDKDTVYIRTIKAKSKLDAIKKMKDFQSKELSLKRIEEIPLKARMELDKSKDKKATLISIEGNIDDIIKAATPENKQILIEKKDKILNDLKKQFNI